MIRKSYKQALGLPVTLPTEKLLSLGLNNTQDKIIKAQRVWQLERLTRSDTRRHILQSLSLGHPTISDTHVDIPQVIRDQLVIHPLPKHMHTVHNEEGRRAKAEALHKQHSFNPQVAYVDAAEQPGREAMATVVVDSSRRTLAALSFPTQFPTVGEEMAIALAIISSPKIITIISDSKSGITNYSNGRVDPRTLRLALQASKFPKRKIYIVWATGHSEIPGNELAHEVARELVIR